MPFLSLTTSAMSSSLVSLARSSSMAVSHGGAIARRVGGCALGLPEDLHRIEGIADLDRTRRDITKNGLEKVPAVAAGIDPLLEQRLGARLIDGALGLPVHGGILGMAPDRLRVGKGSETLHEAVAIARRVADIA